LGAAYFNTWYDLVAQADVWIFGHTHHAVDTVVSGCRVVSNPKGYPGERSGFSSEFTAILEATLAIAENDPFEG
jgi:predicted phosphodiesterase